MEVKGQKQPEKQLGMLETLKSEERSSSRASCTRPVLIVMTPIISSHLISSTTLDVIVSKKDVYDHFPGGSESFSFLEMLPWLLKSILPTWSCSGMIQQLTRQNATSLQLLQRFVN